MKKVGCYCFGIGVSTILMVFTACQKDAPNAEKSVQEIKNEGKISDIIRSPITAEGPEDTINVAKMEFEESIFDFGEVDEGAIVKHEFKFRNTGKVPLLINNAHSTCGCTIPTWPRDPIAPGQSGEIKVEFNTKMKADFQEKPVIITANTYPSITKVYLKGNVFNKSNSN